MLDSFQTLLQEMCGDAVPRDYLALLQNYPHQLFGFPRAEDKSGGEGVVSDVELLCQPDDVLEINREARATGITGPDREEFFWPEQLLIIGENGEGDYFCVDTSGEHGGVLQYRHHAVEFEQIADSLNEFVELLLKAFHSE